MYQHSKHSVAYFSLGPPTLAAEATDGTDHASVRFELQSVLLVGSHGLNAESTFGGGVLGLGKPQ